MLRLSDLEKAQLDKLRELLMNIGLDRLRRVGLEPPKDFSYGAIVKLCADALIKYLDEYKDDL